MEIGQLRIPFLRILVSLFLTYCQSPLYYPQLPQDPEPVVITGNILNYQEGSSKDSIVFYPDDILTGFNDPQYFAIKPAGEFKLAFSTAITHEPFLSYKASIMTI